MRRPRLPLCVLRFSSNHVFSPVRHSSDFSLQPCAALPPVPVGSLIVLAQSIYSVAVSGYQRIKVPAYLVRYDSNYIYHRVSKVAELWVASLVESGQHELSSVRQYMTACPPGTPTLTSRHLVALAWHAMDHLYIPPTARNRGQRFSLLAYATRPPWTTPYACVLVIYCRTA